MTVYLASRFSTIEDMRQKAKELRAIGIKCSSSWLRERAAPGSTIHDDSPSAHRKHAEQDLMDIEDSDVLVLFTVEGTAPTVRGGRHFEAGYAYGFGTEVWVCGPRENIFYFMDGVTQFDD